MLNCKSPLFIDLIMFKQGEYAQPFQVQGVLPSGVSKPQGEVWHWRPGFLGMCTSLMLNRINNGLNVQHIVSTDADVFHQYHRLLHVSLFFNPLPTFFSFHPFIWLNPFSQSREWVGSIWRSWRPGSVQLSFSHVYIRVRLAAVSGAVGGTGHYKAMSLDSLPDWVCQ